MFDCVMLSFVKDRATVDRFNLLRKLHPTAELAIIESENWDFNPMEDFLKTLNISSTHLWIVDPYVVVPSDFDFSFLPNEHNIDLPHYFNCLTRNEYNRVVGIKLVPSSTINDLSSISQLYYQSIPHHVVDSLLGIDDSPILYDVIYARNIHESAKFRPETSKYWIVNHDLKLISDDLLVNIPPSLHKEKNTVVFKIQSVSGKDLGYGGLMLVNSLNTTENFTQIDQFAMTTKHAIPIYYSRNHYEIFKNSSDDFYWWVDKSVEVLPNFDFDFYPDVYQMNNVFSFSNGTIMFVNRKHLMAQNLSEDDFLYGRFPDIVYIQDVVSTHKKHPVFYVSDGDNTSMLDPRIPVVSSYCEAASKTETGNFWSVDTDVIPSEKLFEIDIHVSQSERDTTYVFQKKSKDYGGIKLYSSSLILENDIPDDVIRRVDFGKKIYVNSFGPLSSDIPYDVVFLSYSELNADENYSLLLTKVPSAKRVDGITGILNAHRKAAEISETKMVFVVDADAIIMDDYNFDYHPDYWNEDVVHVWTSKNPVNSLTYGYGGVKLFPRKMLLSSKEHGIDMTTTISDRFKLMPQISNITAFNVDPFNSWKSAFRECVKLASGKVDGESSKSLDIWCSEGRTEKFGEYVISGAKMGRKYGSEHVSNLAMLTKINEYDWLRTQFNKTFCD